jgi:ferredoxin
MIITKQKPEEEILKMTEPFENIFIVGCGKCATTCQTGGEKQIHETIEKISNKVSGFTVGEEPCDQRLTRRDLKPHRETIDGSDAILVMNCGVGVQVIAEQTGKVVLPALETMFIGTLERIGRYHERCKACQECILHETGGICPIARCPKTLLNGPCGGQVEGKCEVGDYENDCAWIKIYDSLKDQNRLELFTEFRPPRDNSKKVLTTKLIL